MAKINVLDSSIYNKISAGEVVERPASVIKELTENSIDAGAKNITIEIRNGGIDEMIITDDGCGIENESVKNAFLPHATSKISNVEDLEAILTLGFRGEALASIASVSQVQMITKTEFEELATKIEIEGGEIKIFENCSAPVGTKVSVKNLFYNVPARKKFLKKPKQEEREITSIVQKLILSNPNVSIRYIVDDKQIYYSTGKNLEDAIFSIYGISTLQNLLKFDDKREEMHIYGYIGKPSFTKANRTYQTLVVNNRCVQNTNIAVAVNKGFETHLMKGQFPFFVMFLDINPQKIDVNVHPTKMEVRFEDNSLIFSFVYRTISNTILSNQELYTIDMIDKPIKSIQDTASESISIDNNIEPLKTIETNLEYKDKSSVLNKTNQLELFENAEIQNPKNTEQKECNLSNRNLYNNELKQNISLENKQEIKTNEQTKEFSQYKVKIYDTKNDEILELKNVNIDKVNESVIPFEFNSITKNDLNKNTFFKQGFNTNALENLQIDNEENLQKLSKGVSLLQKGYKVVGKLFNTYLFIECNDCAILIDQHATHERLIYDKLKKYYDNKNVVTQDLLVPYLLEVNAQEKIFIEDNLQQFYELGFVIEEFGDKEYKISAVPHILGGNFDCKSFFDDVLSQIGKEIKAKEMLRFDEYLMQRACKSAIKGGNDINENEICSLVDAVLENNTELFCPHGRPIAIKIDKKDIEKWFKRVL